MKRLAALLFLLLSLAAPAAQAEYGFIPMPLPAISAEYGLSEFYRDLEAQWGPSKLWTLEQKAWLSDNKQALLALEIERCNALGWTAYLPFTLELNYYAHGLPDEQAIPLETALTMAFDHLAAQGSNIIPEQLPYAGFFYLVDQPAQPVWHFAFAVQSQNIHTYMDARTGQFSQTNRDEVVRLATEHLLGAGIKVARQPLTAENIPAYAIIPYYRPADGQWDVRFQTDYPATHEFVVTVDDVTQEVLGMDSTNG